MSIEAVSVFDETTEELSFRWTETVVWNGRQVNLQNERRESSITYSRNILENNEKIPSEIFFRARGGTASVSVEKDSNGTTTVELEVETKSNDGTVAGSISGSVDSNGKSTVEAEISYSW